MRSKCSLTLLLVLRLFGAGGEPYQLAVPGYRYQFPRDHFNHPEFQTEWWYYTGNLRAADGHRFGFELTFFRQGVSRAANIDPWFVHDLWMAHLALSDVTGQRFYHEEGLNRAGPGLAGGELAGADWRTRRGVTGGSSEVWIGVEIEGGEGAGGPGAERGEPESGGSGA